MNLSNDAIQAGQIIPLDHRHIEAILFVDTPGTADRPVEVRAALRDGRTFAFTAYTPAALARVMRESRAQCVVDVGLLVVSAVTPDAVIEALERALVIGIERFGLAV